jgi:hypothetical protein
MRALVIEANEHYTPAAVRRGKPSFHGLPAMGAVMVFQLGFDSGVFKNHSTLLVVVNLFRT